MGVTEDIPREHIERSVTVILDTLKECGGRKLCGDKATFRSKLKGRPEMSGSPAGAHTCLEWRATVVRGLLLREGRYLSIKR